MGDYIYQENLFFLILPMRKYKFTVPLLVLCLLVVAACTIFPQSNQPTKTQQPQPNPRQVAVSVLKTEKQFGYVKNVYTKDGRLYLDLDAAEMLTGKDAEKAAFEDGQCSKADYAIPGTCAPNDYYIRNKDQQLITLAVSKNVKIEITSVDGSTDIDARGTLAAQIFTISEFQDYFDKDYDKPPFILVTPYKLEILSGEVVKISQQYLP